MKKDHVTVTQKVINVICSFKSDLFRIQDVIRQAPELNPRTISTTISRDLKNKGIVVREGRKANKPVVYRLIRSSDLECNKPIEKEETPFKEESPYLKIGKGIEELILEKNQKIERLKRRLDIKEKEVIEYEAMVQDRDRHITEQGKKIHELSEKLRNRQGSNSIKLDELQNIVNQPA